MVILNVDENLPYEVSIRGVRVSYNFAECRVCGVGGRYLLTTFGNVEFSLVHMCVSCYLNERLV